MTRRNLVSVDEAVVEKHADGVSGDRNTPEMLEWLKDAGFGLFIHWSVDVQLGCVISHTLVGSSKDYADRYYTELPKTFNPNRWDADRVARLAK
ncbi:MAG: alpha-L-fucosidase, partial [Clostridia bacterium]|nr:alpha-L-fucosidase [Clostridia bacterium]